MASSNIDAINKGWIDLSKKHKSLQNLSHNIESITNDKGSSIYRLKTGNFNSKEEADKFCNNLKKEEQHLQGYIFQINTSLDRLK